jgi:WD40 repeat protein
MTQTTSQTANRMPADLEPRWRADLDGHHIVGLRWAPDGATLAAATADGPIGLFDADDGRWRHTLAGHALGTLALAWHPAGAVLASGGQDGKLRLWDAADGVLRTAVDGGGAWVERLAWSPVAMAQAPVARGRNAPAPAAPPQQGVAILATAAGKTLRLWDAHGLLLREYRDHPSTIADIAWRPGVDRNSGAPLLAAATYGGITLRRPHSDEAAGRFDWKGSTLVISWSPDGRYIATGDQDSTVHFWIARTGQDLQMWGYPTKVRELAWDHTSRFLATGGGAVVTVWDCSGKGPEGTRPLQLDLHTEQLTGLAFQHRGPLLASGCAEGLVAIWNVGRSRRPMATFRVSGGVSQIAWSPDDRTLAVGSESGDLVALPIG